MGDDEIKIGTFDIVIEEDKSGDSDFFVDVETIKKQDVSSLTLQSQNRKRMLLSRLNSAPSARTPKSVLVPTREPSQSFLMTYSGVSQPKIKLEIDPRLVNTLQASPKQIARRPSVRRSNFSPSNRSCSGPFDCLPLLDCKLSSYKLSNKPKKKVRFADTVVIHRISVHKGSAPPPPEMFIMIISLREIWKQLDLDKDKHLNMSELRRFADEVWENEDVGKMMRSYASHPNKGLSFGEWAAVLKEEDADMTELIEDLYEIFVYESESEDDEKGA